MSKPRPPSASVPKLVALIVCSVPFLHGPAHAQPELPPGLLGNGPTLEQTPAGETDPLRRARDALLAAGDAAAALPPAEQIVERPDADVDPAYPSDLVRLGVALSLLGEHEAAEQRFLDAADAIRAADGEFALALVEPYRALGQSYLRERRFVEAIAALEQAQHVSQRNLGLFTVAQTGVIDDLTTAYLGLGDVVTAARLQRERLDNAVRQFGELDPRTVPYRYDLARYYEESRLRGAARREYERVVEALEPLGEAALLAPLRQLLRIELRLRDRDEARARIAAILAGGAEVSAVERARSLAALGDFALARDRDPTAAGAHYAEAYALLADAADERARLFDQPEMLDFVAPLTAVDRDERNRPYAWGTIVLRFDVQSDGRARDVSVVSADPAGIVDAAYVRRIGEANFRPRLVAGEPTTTQGVRYTHYFRYYVARN